MSETIEKKPAVTEAITANVRVTGYRWAILGAIFLGCITAGLTQFVLTIYGPQLMAEFGMSESQFSTCVTAPMLTGVFFSMFCGVLADKIGVRWTILIAGVIGIAGALLRVYAGAYGTLFIASFLLGLFGVFISSNAVKVLSEWFPKKELGLAMGIFMAGGATGNTIAPTFYATFFDSYEASCWFCVILMVVVLLVVVLLIRDRPKGQEAPEVVSVKANLGGLLKLKHIWFIGLFMVFFMAFNITANTFLPTALITNGMVDTQAAFCTSSFSLGILIASIVGAPFVSLLNKGKFRVPGLILSVLSAAFFLIGWMLKSAALTPVFCFLSGFCVCCLVPIVTAALVLVPGMRPEYAGAAGGFGNTTRFLSAFVVPSFIFAKIAGSNYDLMFVFVALSAILMGLFAFLLPEVLAKKEAE